jgi:hypothetical protein
MLTQDSFRTLSTVVVFLKMASATDDPFENSETKILAFKASVEFFHVETPV